MFVKGDMLPADSPVRYGCFLVILIGVVLFGIGGWMLIGSAGPTPLRVALVITGAAAAALGWTALFGSRIGWAFATALVGTLAVVCLFGAPKLRDATNLTLLGAALPSIILAIATVLMSLVPPDDEAEGDSDEADDDEADDDKPDDDKPDDDESDDDESDDDKSDDDDDDSDKSD